MKARIAVPQVKFKLLVFFVALVVSSITLWLIESPLKYVLYVFEVALILILFYSLFGKTKKIRIKNKLNPVIKLDYAFLSTSTILFVLNALKLYSVLTFGCAIIISFFLPGYVLLRLSNKHYLESWIEWLVLSFALSITLTSIIFTATLPLSSHQAVIVPAIFVGMSLCPLLKDRICKSDEKQQFHAEHSTKEYDLSNVLILLWITIFTVFAISSLYPQMSFRPGLDIVRLFSSSRLLALAPSASSSPYPFFNGISANIYLLSNPTMEVFQTGLAYLSIMVIASFYIMANAYLKNVDNRAPMVAAISFSVFAGLGWLYFLTSRITTTAPYAYYDLLRDTFNRSYFDVGYAQGWIWFWFRPLTLGLTLFFILLYLLRQNRLDKRLFILTFTLISIALNFVHFSESFIFVLFLLVLSLLKPITQLRIQEAAASSILAMLVSSLLLFTYQNIIGMSITTGPTHTFLLFLTAVSVLSLLFARLKKRPALTSLLNHKWLRWLIIGASITYIWLLITWLLTANSFPVEYMPTVYSVPWQFYPMLLGLSGFFAIFSLIIIIKSYSKNAVIIFLLLILFSVFFGRSLTYYNLQISHSGYWERRVVTIAYAASAVLSSILIVELSKRIKKRKALVLTTFLSILVILSVSSTFLALELQAYNANNYTINDNQLKLVNMLDKLSPDKVMLTAAYSSMRLAEFSPSSWIINTYRFQLWSAAYPELPLAVLYSMNKPVTIFLQEDDILEINKKYSSSYLFNHTVLNSSPNNSANIAEIISLPNMTAPSSKSQTVLVVPAYNDPATCYAYDILSQAGLNYTTSVVDDINTISKAKILIASTEDIALKLISYHELFKLNSEVLIILNLDGNTDLCPGYPSKTTLSLDSVSKEIATLNVNNIAVENLTITGDSQEFEIQSIYENGHFYDLLDENFEGWTSSGIGFGNISTPQLTLNYNTRKSGDSSIQIDVTAGSFGYWQVSKNFTAEINADNFDFISFYWYGRGDGKNYVLNYHSSSSSNYWYYFKDSWSGWKKVLIPMRVPDGRYNLNDVFFVKFTNGEPTWNNIRKIEIRNEGSNRNLAGTFLIDKFGFESAETVNATIQTGTSFCGFNLFNYNSTNWVKIAEITSNKTISISSYTLMSGLNSTVIFGDKSFLEINLNNQSEYSISVKLPPSVSQTIFSTIQLKIIPINPPVVEVDEIRGPDSSLQLNTKVNVIPFTTSNNVIAWYKNKNNSIPFAINDNIDNFKIIYTNIYPLISAFSSDKNNFDLLGQIPHTLNLNQLISEAKITAENPVRGNLVAFSKLDFEGDATIYSPATVIIRKINNTLTLSLLNNTLMDLSRIIIIGDDIILSAKNGTLNNGMGFYSNIYSDNLKATSIAGRAETIKLEFNNGTELILNESINNIQITGNSVATLRQPTIQINGKVAFHDLYTYGSISYLRILGEDATLEGRLSFDTKFGDEFTVAINFVHTGKINPDKYYYDELNVLYQSLPMFFIIGIVVILIYTYTLLAKKKLEIAGAHK